MAEVRRDPQPGDLIEIDRPRHQHWVLYVGDGYIINLTPVGKEHLKLGVHTVPVFNRKVKKELLKEVARKNTWHVNNMSDQKHTPLPVEEIIRHAEGYIGKQLTYRVFGSNCERFVKKLRYGGELRAFVGGELDVPHMRDDKDYPKPGDLIEIERRYYKHWALCVGDGYVIHVTPVDEGATTLSASSGTILSRKAKVMKELLEEVAVNDHWAVNNKYDCHRTPLPVEEILWRAECCIGKELPYYLLGRYSEDFVTNLRYGGQRAFLCGEMQLQGMTDHKDYPNPGDLIEIKRRRVPLLGYQHWALYLGKGHVIHVATLDEGAPSMSPSNRSILTRRAKVKKELLKDVAENDAWGVNNKYDYCRAPFPMEEIIRRAEQWIDKEVPYRLFLSNCEHFVTMLRYGEGVSDQIRKVFNNGHGISAAVSAGFVAASSVVPGAPVVVAAGVGTLAALGLVSGNIAHFVIRVKFKKAGRDILEKTCC